MDGERVAKLVERLRAAGEAEREEAGRAMREQGREDGLRWAEHEATPEQLRTVAMAEDPDDAAGVFASFDTGQAPDDEAWREGFIDGAEEVWNVVKTRL